MTPLVLLLIAILLLCRTRTGWFVALTASLSVLLLLLLSLAYLAADRLTGAGIDQSVLYHLRTGIDSAGIAQHLPLIAGVVAALTLCLALSLWLCLRLRSAHPRPRGGRATVALALALIAVGHAIHPAVADLRSLYAHNLLASPDATPPDAFVVPPQVQLGQRKRLIVLYLESLERTYLDERLFPGLAPNLQRLEKQAISFTDIRQAWSTHWTIAGIVSSQCGVPLVTPSHENSMSGTDRFLTHATCLGDVLQQAGYTLTYLGGAASDFAGKGAFLRTHGYSDVLGRNKLADLAGDPDYRSDWGLFDDTLFKLLADRADALLAADSPAALVALTLDTHAPHGYLSRPCQSTRYGDGSNAMLNAVHCSDRLAAEFIEHVRSHPGFENTLLLVMSDHLAMQNSASDRLEQGNRRNLALLFEHGAEPALIDKPGTTMDVAATLLNRMGAQLPGFGFGRDLLGDAPTLAGSQGDGLDAYLIGQHSFLRSLWELPQLYAGIGLDAEGRIQAGTQALKPPLLLTLDRALKVTGLKFEFASPTPLAKLVKELNPDQGFLWVDRCAAIANLHTGDAWDDAPGLCLAAGRTGAADITRLPLDASFRMAYRDLRPWFAPMALNGEAHARRQAQLSDWLRYGTRVQRARVSSRRMTEIETMLHSGTSPSSRSTAGVFGDPAPLTLARGLSLLGLDEGGAPHVLAHVDSCGDPELSLRHDGRTLQARSFGDVAVAHDGTYDAFAVVAHDSAVCQQFDLTPLFSGTDLVRWRELGFRAPYVGVFANARRIREFAGQRDGQLTVAVVGQEPVTP